MNGPRGGGVKVTQIAQDATPNRLVYDPGHPDADPRGYVSMPNVQPVTEMVDLITRLARLRGERHGHADRQADVLQDAGAPALMPTIPIDPSFAISGGDWSVAGLGDGGIPPGSRAPPAASGRTSAACSPTRSARWRSCRPKPPRARAQLAAGTAADPTEVVMAIERARLSMQLASQIRTKAVESIQDIFHTQV